MNAMDSMFYQFPHEILQHVANELDARSLMRLAMVGDSRSEG